MSIVSTATLKTYFQTGDFPTQAQFEDLIDTLENTGELSAEIEMSSAELLTGNATPKDIIPAPGVGKLIAITSAWAEFTYNGVPYITNLSFQLITDTATQSQILWTNLLACTVTNTRRGTVSAPTGATATQLIENKKVVAQVATGNPADGTGTLKISCRYKILDTPF